MKPTTAILGFGVWFAITLVSVPAAANDCGYGTPLTRQLRDDDVECYDKIKEDLDTADKLAKYRKNGKWHAGLGELQLKLQGAVTNTFDSWDTGASVIIDKARGFAGADFGYVNKKWLRDFMVARNPERYVKRENTWAIEALTLTATVGYRYGIFSPNDFEDREFDHNFIYAVKGDYTISFDKINRDID